MGVPADDDASKSTSMKFVILYANSDVLSHFKRK